jgi:hypothetical protein
MGVSFGRGRFVRPHEASKKQGPKQNGTREDDETKSTCASGSRGVKSCGAAKNQEGCNQNTHANVQKGKRDDALRDHNGISCKHLGNPDEDFALGAGPVRDTKGISFVLLDVQGRFSVTTNPPRSNHPKC